MIADVFPETDSKHFSDLPVLALCGYSGAGKTTLIERLIDLLRQRGLTVAVVKHDVHGLALDPEGKDSDRFFKAGADVYMRGPEEGFTRLHNDASLTIEKQVFELARRYDMVLIEGHKQTPLQKVWLLSDTEIAPPDGIANVVAVLTRDQDRISPVMEIIDRQLLHAVKNERLCGAVLIGGKSRRMGRPKHLIVHHNMTWLERSVSLLERVCSTVVIAGSGRLPERLADTPRVPDVPDVTGPLAGILAAMRWLPDASWLMTACDMPTLSPDVLMWLLAQRRPGVWAVLPSDADNAVCQPLPAYYNSRCGSVLAAACHRNNVGPSMLIDHPKTESPAIPPALAGAWRNVNTPSELAAIQDDYNNMQPR